jgi:hypothetical protein
VRKIVEVVLDHQDSYLRDDATVFLVEWHGDRPANAPPDPPHPDQ